MRHSKLLITTFFLAIASATALYATVKGQSSDTPTSGLSVSPPTFDVSGNPGDTVSNTVRLENINDHPVKIAVDIRNFTAIGEEGAVGLTEENTSFSLSSWVSVEPSTITIPAKSTHVFRYTINIPLSAEPGGHFGSLIFRTIPEEKLEGSGATLAQELGSLILLRIAGSTTEDAKIETFAPSQPFYEYGPVTLETRVNNLGNVHIKPTGTISITNMIGKKVATIPLDSKNVLPGAIRKLDSTWDTKWRLGRYTATVVMVYGRDMTQRASVTNFIVLPYKVVGSALVAIIIFTYLLYKSRKRIGAAIRILMTGKA